jgi:hypothetical protein
MPSVEGSAGTGWLVLFTANETKRIAEPVGNYAGPVAAPGGRRSQYARPSRVRTLA